MLLQGGQSVAGHSVPGSARAVPRRDAQPGRLLLGASGGQARQPGGRRRGHGSNLLRAGGPHLPLHRIFRQLQVREPRTCFLPLSLMHFDYPSILSLSFPFSVSVQFIFFRILILSSS